MSDYQFPSNSPKGAVASVAGKTGAVTLAASDLTNGTTGTGSVVLSDSAALTGTPTAPTRSAGDNSTKVATTAYVDAAEALDEKVANKDVASGYAGLDSGGLLKMSEMPSGVEKTANKDAASGYAGLDASVRLKLAEQASAVDARTTTSEAIVDGDRAKLVTFSNTAATAATIAQAGVSSLFVAGWYCDILNLNTGTVTLTPATSTVNGQATLVLQAYEGGRLVSDGTNFAFITGSVTQDTPNDADVLTFEVATKKWRSKAIAAIGGANASQLRGKNISSAAPSDQQVLKWSVADNQYDLVLCDGLVHGDSIWNADPLVVRLYDDFFGGATSSTQAQFGNLNWMEISNSAWTPIYYDGAPPHLGILAIPIAALAGSANGLCKASGTGGSAQLNGGSPLLDYPGWKMTWVWRWGYLNASLGSLLSSTINSSSKMSNYIGMANPGLLTGNAVSRPCAFVGLRFDTDAGAQQVNNSGSPTVPSLQISDTTMKLECIANPINGNGVRDNAQGLKILQKIAAVSSGGIASGASLTASFNTVINPSSFIVVVAAVGGTTAPSVTDTTADTFVQNASKNDAGNAFSVYIFSAPTSSTGATSSTNTISVKNNNGASQSIAFTAYEVMSTQGGTISFDASVGAAGTGTAVSTAAIANAGQDELVFEGTAVGTTVATVSNAAGSGWLLDATQNVGGTPAGLFTLGSSYRQTTLDTTPAGSATIAASNPWAQIVGSFKVSVSSFFDTGIAPVVGQWYRLELKCVAAGQVTVTLFTAGSSYSHTFTVPKYTIGSLVTGSGTCQATGTFARFSPSIVPSGTGVARIPFGNGSIVTLANLTGANPSGLNGNQTILTSITGATVGAAIDFYNSASSFLATSTKGTVSGYSVYSPVIMFGTPTISTGFTTDFIMEVDKFMFVWDTSLASSPQTLNPNYSCYVSVPG